MLAQPMRIGIFTSTFLPKVGGTERSVDAMARAFAARGHDVVVITHDKHGVPEVPYPLFQFPRPRFRRRWPGVFAGPLRRAWARHRFDVLLCTNGNPTAYGAGIARKLGPRFAIVANPRGFDLYPTNIEHMSRGWRRWTRRGYRNADRIVAISSYMTQRLREWVGEPLPPIDLVFNGVNIEERRAAAARAAEAFEHDQVQVARRYERLRDRRFILQLARVEPRKRQGLVVEALARARNRLDAVDLCYVIAGQGNAMADVQAAIERHGLGNRVFMVGLCGEPDKSWLLENARFMVASSIEEGMPNVVLEALAHGRPVLASDILPHRDILEGRACARLFRTDDRDELETQLRAMIDADHETMSADARAASASFSVDQMIAGYERAFERALAERQG